MFMFPDEQTPPLNKATVDHIVNTVEKYASAQFHLALEAHSGYMTKIRLSRAIGALDAIMPFIGVNPAIDALRDECNQQWRRAGLKDSDPDDAWLYGDIHDISEF